MASFHKYYSENTKKLPVIQKGNKNLRKFQEILFFYSVQNSKQFHIKSALL